MNRTTPLLLVAAGINVLLLVVLYVVLADPLRDHALPFFGIGLLFTAILAGVLFWMTDSASPEAAEPPVEQPASPPRPTQASPAPAVQLLSILQRKGRLLDFLHEDIQQYEDAQIGAAVRTVHEGCKKALDEIVDLEPVLEDAEGSTITVESGFDAQSIRLTGNVEGDPPFRGELRHRGWRVARIELPERMRETDDVVAAAEVEVS